MFNELTRLTYLSFYMWESGTGRCDVVVYEAAEHALNRAVEEAERTGVWQLSPPQIGAIEQMLAAYDDQIATVSAGSYMQAVLRLDRVLARSEPQSPVAKMVEARKKAERSPQLLT
jgi:hypothetical protein